MRLSPRPWWSFRRALVGLVVGVLLFSGAPLAAWSAPTPEPAPTDKVKAQDNATTKAKDAETPTADAETPAVKESPADEESASAEPTDEPTVKDEESATPEESGSPAEETEPAASEDSGTPDVAAEDESDEIVAQAVPPATGNNAVISVKVGGTRVGTTAVSSLDGVVLGFYDAATGGSPIYQCTSDSDGDCSITVPNTQAAQGGQPAGANRDRRFWVRQISTPTATNYSNPTLGNGGGDDPITSSSYRFQTCQQLRAGNTCLSSNIGANGFMLSTGNELNASGGIWQNSLNNPNFPAKCGINVALVLDFSNSVTNPQLVQLKAAANGFVDALTGTPSQVGTFTFATNAPASAGDTLALTSVSTSASATTVKNKITNYTRPAVAVGGTNWDRGLYQVAQSAARFDVAVVITDGDPTQYNSPATGPGNFTRFREVENGIFSANAIKDRGHQSHRVRRRRRRRQLRQRRESSVDLRPDAEQRLLPDQRLRSGRRSVAPTCPGQLHRVDLRRQAGRAGGCAGQLDRGRRAARRLDIHRHRVVRRHLRQPQRPGDRRRHRRRQLPAHLRGRHHQRPCHPQRDPAIRLHLAHDQRQQRDLHTHRHRRQCAGDKQWSYRLHGNGGLRLSGELCVYNMPPQPLASVILHKRWVVNGTTYNQGDQPTGLVATALLNAVAREWDIEIGGFRQGDSVTVNEVAVTALPLCQITSRRLTNQNGTTVDLALPSTQTLNSGVNNYTLTNTATCTTRLQLAKSVEGGIDPPPAAGWTLTATPPTGTGFSGSTGVNQLVTADVRYTLSENDAHPEYRQFVDPNAVLIPGATGSWNCQEVTADGGTVVPGFSDGLNGGVVVPFGRYVRCTAVNQTATLRLVKEVFNDNGGTAVPADWDLTATPTGAFPPGLLPQTRPGADLDNAEYFDVRPGARIRPIGVDAAGVHQHRHRVRDPESACRHKDGHPTAR